MSRPSAETIDRPAPSAGGLGSSGQAVPRTVSQATFLSLKLRAVTATPGFSV